MRKERQSAAWRLLQVFLKRTAMTESVERSPGETSPACCGMGSQVGVAPWLSALSVEIDFQHPPFISQHTSQVSKQYFPPQNYSLIAGDSTYQQLRLLLLGKSENLLKVSEEGLILQSAELRMDLRGRQGAFQEVPQQFGIHQGGSVLYKQKNTYGGQSDGGCLVNVKLDLPLLA